MTKMSIENVEELIGAVQDLIGQAFENNDMSKVDELNEELSDLEDELFRARMRDSGEDC